MARPLSTWTPSIARPSVALTDADDLAGDQQRRLAATLDRDLGRGHEALLGGVNPVVVGHGLRDPASSPRSAKVPSVSEISRSWALRAAKLASFDALRQFSMLPSPE